MMLLKSKVGGGAVGRSTYLAQDYHVDNEHCHWQEDHGYDCFDLKYEITSSIVKTPDDTSDDWDSQCAK